MLEITLQPLSKHIPGYTINSIVIPSYFNHKYMQKTLNCEKVKVDLWLILSRLQFKDFENETKIRYNFLFIDKSFYFVTKTGTVLKRSPISG